MTPEEMLKEFHRAIGDELPDQPRMPWNHVLHIRQYLIWEEYNEVCDRLEEGAVLEDLAKELADLVYVCIGTAVVCGIPFDEVFAEVHRSNMSKFRGEKQFRADGKLLKGPHYEPPDLESIFKRAMEAKNANE